MATAKSANPMLAMVEDFAHLAEAGQAAALRMLQAEMEALNQVMPGHHAHPDEAEQRRIDAAIESDHDNLPV